MLNKYLSSEQKYTALGLIAVFIWSFAAFLATEIVSIPPFELLACQFALAFFVTLIRYRWSSDKADFFNFSLKDLIFASLALILNQACYFTAFRFSDAAEVDLVNSLWPTLLILLSSFLPKERFCFAYAFSCCICLWGVFVLFSNEEIIEHNSTHIYGLLLALGAAISWALYSVYTRYRGQSSANCLTSACGLAALGCTILHMYFEDQVIPTHYELGIILVLGAVQVGLAFYFWESSLKKGKVKVIGLAAYSIPILSVFILVFFNKAELNQSVFTAMMAISFAPMIPYWKNSIQEKYPNLSTQLRTQVSQRLTKKP